MSKSLNSELQFLPLGNGNDDIHLGYTQVRCKSHEMELPWWFSVVQWLRIHLPMQGTWV